ncbi:MAG: hypothetical protein AAB356_02600, partial [Deltaproteobacteria bacterium]
LKEILPFGFSGAFVGTCLVICSFSFLGAGGAAFFAAVVFGFEEEEPAFPVAGAAFFVFSLAFDISTNYTRFIHIVNVNQ